jgi:hypothetical protein
MAMCDYEGSGSEHLTRDDIEVKIENDLSRNGWGDRCTAIVIKPELENWIWVNSIHMERAIDWNQDIDIRTWAIQHNYLQNGNAKPQRPKESFEAALKLCNMPRSSSIYKDIASRASHKKCIDPAFIKFITTLRNWFPKQ